MFITNCLPIEQWAFSGSRTHLNRFLLFGVVNWSDLYKSVLQILQNKTKTKQNEGATTGVYADINSLAFEDYLTRFVNGSMIKQNNAHCEKINKDMITSHKLLNEFL